MKQFEERTFVLRVKDKSDKNGFVVLLPIEDFMCRSNYSASPDCRLFSSLDSIQQHIVDYQMSTLSRLKATPAENLRIEQCFILPVDGESGAYGLQGTIIGDQDASGKSDFVLSHDTSKNMNKTVKSDSEKVSLGRKEKNKSHEVTMAEQIEETSGYEIWRLSPEPDSSDVVQLSLLEETVSVGKIDTGQGNTPYEGHATRNIRQRHRESLNEKLVVSVQDDITNGDCLIVGGEETVETFIETASPARCVKVEHLNVKEDGLENPTASDVHVTTSVAELVEILESKQPHQTPLKFSRPSSKTSSDSGKSMMSGTCISKGAKPKCWKCDAVCLNSSLLLNHIKKEHMEVTPVVCSFCEETIKTPCSLQRHYRKHKSVESSGRPLSCRCCLQSFDNRQEYWAHTKEHSLTCRWCQKELANYTYLSRHVKRVHIGEERTVCPLCGKKVKLIHSHMISHRTKPTCHMCGKSCGSLDVLERHILMHSKKAGGKSHPRKHKGKKSLKPSEKQTEKRKVKQKRNPSGKKERNTRMDVCPKCGKVVKYLLSHLKHKHDKQKMADNKFLCDVCGGAFPSPGALQKHSIRHTSQENFFTCPVCGIKIIRKGSFESHMKRHAEGKQFKCDVCGAKFFCQAYLRDHMRRHTGERRFACEFCDRKFAKKVTLKDHMRSHMAGITFTCPVCGLLFENEASIIKHRVEHYQFACDLCGKKYSTEKWLNIHLQKHEGIKPFSCETCGKMFCVETNLVVHRLSHF